jgi:hypothetical protein
LFKRRFYQENAPLLSISSQRLYLLYPYLAGGHDQPSQLPTVTNAASEDSQAPLPDDASAATPANATFPEMLRLMDAWSPGWQPPLTTTETGEDSPAPEVSPTDEPVANTTLVPSDPANSGQVVSGEPLLEAREGDTEGTADATAEGNGTAEAENIEPPPTNAETDATGEKMSEEELAMVRELQMRDREVRQHESAHQAASGGYAGAASFTYQQGPDGKRYAIGGEVSIDMSDASSPEATIAKMQLIRSSAMAPANPSGQDMAVAASAAARLMEAQSEVTQARQEEQAERESEATERQEETPAAGAANPAENSETANPARETTSPYQTPFTGNNANPSANLIDLVA